MKKYNPESVVKENIPFTGSYEGKIIDTKQRLFLPIELMRTFKKRQGKDSNLECTAFIRIGDYPLVGTLIDTPQSNFKNYFPIEFDTQGRFVLSKKMPFQIPEDNQVDFYGIGNSIEIVASNIEL